MIVHCLPMQQFLGLSTLCRFAVTIAVAMALSVIVNITGQVLPQRSTEPPVVFHWFPFIGSIIAYGRDPLRFSPRIVQRCILHPVLFGHQADPGSWQYGDLFTFILMGKKMTVALGHSGNSFVLDGKPKDVSAAEIYSVFTTSVFGNDVIYDCPNSKFMEQKKFVKTALTGDAFRSYVPIISGEVQSHFKKVPDLKGESGIVNIPKIMDEITIFTALHTLQGSAIRHKFETSLAQLYGDLNLGFSPTNFILHWVALPRNRKRDHARRAIAKFYMDTIHERRAHEDKGKELDIMKHLMNSRYKNGTPVPDHEVVHLMVAILMAGEHTSPSTISWIMLRLAQNPSVMEELYEEQVSVLGDSMSPLAYEDLGKLPLNQGVVKKTLRLHAPIHTMMLAVKHPMPVPGTKYVIPTSHILIAAPCISTSDPAYFPNPDI